jgi:hypothetical protein
MSASLAAAKKRRAPASAQTPSPTAYSPNQTVPSSQSQYGQPAGLTLPQVISLVDKRLITLETIVKNSPLLNDGAVGQQTQIPSNITEVLDEFNARTERLAEEIENLKNIVLSLQTYTMDVNKMLLEERAQLLGGANA